MTRIGLSLGIALVALVPLCATAEDHHNVVQADSFKWAAGPPSLPKGAAIALLFGDPDKKGTLWLSDQRSLLDTRYRPTRIPPTKISR